MRSYLIKWLQLLAVDPQRLAVELERSIEQTIPFAGDGKLAINAILLPPRDLDSQGTDSYAGKVSREGPDAGTAGIFDCDLPQDVPRRSR